MSQPVADERLLVDVAATLSVTLLDAYGEPADASGTVTVDVAKENGDTVATAGSTSNPSGTGTYTYSLAQGSNTDVDLLVATWKDGGTARLVTRHEIVGGFLFSIAEMEARETDLGDITDGGTVQAKARRVRDEVERECEDITGAAWTRHYRRVRVDGSGRSSLLLKGDGAVWNPRTVRSVREYTDEDSYTSFTAAELAAIECKEWGELVRRDGASWPSGTQNLVIEVEHGYDRPPEDLKHAAMTRFESLWHREDSAVPDRAERYVLDGGATFVLAMPSTRRTGIPDVDAVYLRHSKHTAL